MKFDKTIAKGSFWGIKQKVEKEGLLWLSPSKIKNAVQPEKDWMNIAVKCSENPQHEHYGKDPHLILEIWKNKSNKGIVRGNTLDTFIVNYFNNNRKAPQRINESDSIWNKFEHWIKWENHIYQLGARNITNQFWVNSELGFRGVVDSIFYYQENNELIIIDWKDKIRFFQDYQNNLLGPLSHLKNFDIHLDTLQTFLYRYALEEIGITDNISTYIIQVNNHPDTNEPFVKKHLPSFQYDKKLIQEVIRYVRNK